MLALRRQPVIDLAAGTGDLCIELQRAGHHRPRLRSQLRHALRRPQRPPPGAGRHPAPPPTRRRRRWRHLRVRPAQPRRSRRLLRRTGPSRAARGAHRPARRRRAPQPASSAGATASTSARWCPGSAPCRDGAAYRYLPKSVAYLPPARSRWSTSSVGRVRRRRAPSALRWAHPVDDRHPRLTCTPTRGPCRRTPRPAESRSTSKTSPVATATSSFATASASLAG